MRFLFFGAGAIGTYIGGSLALSGEGIAFLERPEVAERVRRDGIPLTIADRTRRISVSEVFLSAADAMKSGPFDVCIFALKSYDTAAAIRTLEPLKGRLPPVLCLQNGVENESALESVFDPGSVIPGTVTSAVGRTPAGAVTLERRRGVGIAAGHALSIPLMNAFNRAGLNARPFASAPSMKWSKLLTNLISNATSAILGSPPAEVYANPQLFLLEREMLRECLRVMHASGIPVTDLPGTPVRALALAVQRLPASLARPILVRAVGGGRGGKMPSLYLDLQTGRGKTEVQWLNGAVARFGQTLGVPAPVNALLAETLSRLTDGSENPEKYAQNPKTLIHRLSPDDISRIGLG
ncbi:MAG: 2-dehydropantoate 2-reductase [Anaerolineales bacterium]|nr:2-dehydropantoate 2-reductase [Anaerolineales bacterium]